ncbi:hypothetical protein TRVL_09935 [Trypanosoma vivax]|nr:hypothetical protein TRVL_09935 [Trypanosoma vivax]
MMFLRGVLVLVVLVAAGDALTGVAVVPEEPKNCSFVEAPGNCPNKNMSLTKDEHKSSTKENVKVPEVKGGAEGRGNVGSDSAAPTNGTQPSTGTRDAEGSTADAGSPRDAAKNPTGSEDAVATNERATRTGNVVAAALVVALCVPFLA